MQELISYIACALVDHPGQVAECNLGKMTGRQGRKIKVMRALVNTMAGKQGKTMGLDVLE